MGQYSLQGKTLFITGGASGIGAEVARQASKKGASLALVDVDGEAAARMAASLPNAIGITADVRDYDSLEAAVQETVETYGGIDIAFANAGIEIAHTSGAVPLVEMERLADINFTGVFRTVRAALPHVIERRGYVLITASLAAILHAPPLSHYSASKAGVEAFGNALRMEYRHKGVDVGVAYFGFIDTPMVQRAKSDPILARFEAENGQNFVGKTFPVSGAGAAVVKGMETRGRRVMYPRFIRPMSILRFAMPRFLERAVKPDVIGRLVDELDDRDLRGHDSPDPSREFHERVLANTTADRFDHRGEEDDSKLLS
jgi:NAD(P)-dependent dehydrogenase (short-subunit alcohol dehydrogenase family)